MSRGKKTKFLFIWEQSKFIILKSSSGKKELWKLDYSCPCCSKEWWSFYKYCEMDGENLLELLYNKHQHEHHGGDQWRASFKPCSRPGDQ